MHMMNICEEHKHCGPSSLESNFGFWLRNALKYENNFSPVLAIALEDD